MILEETTLSNCFASLLKTTDGLSKIADDFLFYFSVFGQYIAVMKKQNKKKKKKKKKQDKEVIK